jgi:multidrug efflux pump subunit AcrA (membrane-fusion protein)
MEKLSKIAPVVVIVASAGSLFFAFRLGALKRELRSENARLAQDLEAGRAQLRQAQAQLEQNAMLLQQAHGEVARASADAQAARIALGEKEREADTLRAKASELQQQLEATRTELAAARETLQKIQELTQAADFQNLEQIRAKLVAQADENKLLSEQLTAMRVENQRLKQKLEEQIETPVGLRGRVAHVNESWSFLVLDIGLANRVRPNTEFLVYRDSKFIGKVQVVSVDTHTSIAQILPEYRRGTPRKGDLVVR